MGVYGVIPPDREIINQLNDPLFFFIKMGQLKGSQLGSFLILQTVKLEVDVFLD